jgi:hypothetical protein
MHKVQAYTRLDLIACIPEPCVLAGKMQMQHLDLWGCMWSGTAASSDAHALSHLQHMQQLTHLNLGHVLEG